MAIFNSYVSSPEGTMKQPCQQRTHHIGPQQLRTPGRVVSQVRHRTGWHLCWHLVFQRMAVEIGWQRAYIYMGVSENVVYPIVPNGFADHYPYEKWLFHWEYTLFSDKPI